MHVQNSTDVEALAAEEARIHDAYARRAAAARYSRFDCGHLFMMQQLERRMLALFQKEGLAPLQERKILEIGCGNGHWLREFIQWGARPGNLAGVELLPGRVAEARELCAPDVNIRQVNAARLEFPAESFDVVFQATVFTSILDVRLKTAVAAEMMRVLSRRGVILWYDFRFDNPRNPDVRGVEKAEIRRLFPGCQVTLHRITLAPPLARLLAPVSWTGCQALEKIPWLCTHYLGVIRKTVQGSTFKVSKKGPVVLAN
jgi:ubiquinone/menaquinone biosynthesis C-methylase UbiE